MGIGVKFAVDDESAFADVKKQLTLTDEGEIQKFRQELLKTTETIPLMNNEIYEIAAAAGRAGIAQEELTKFTFDTAKVAVAFGVDAEEAGSNLATWRTSLNMSQKEVMGLADQINVLGDNINVTPKQVGDIVTAMGPLGKIANVTAAQTATLGASLIDFGVKDASTASTALRKLYSTMSSGNAASSTKKSAFQALGFDPVQISEDMQKDSMGTIQKVMGAFKNLSESEKLSVGTQLFGEEAVGALLPLSQHLDKISNNLKMVNDKQKVANSVGKEFANVNKTTAAQLKISQRAILNLSLGFANTMLPAIQSATKGVTSFTNGMNSLTADHPQMTKAISYGAATLVGLRLASGGARLGLEQVFKMKDDYKTFMAAGKKIKEWKQWGPMLSKIKIIGGSTFKMLGKGAMAFGRLALANPWIIAIAAIAAGAYLVYKNWDKVKEGFSVVKAKITELWDKFKESPIGKIFEYTPLGSWIKGIKSLYGYWKKFKGKKENENPLKTPGLNKSRIKTYVPAYAKGGIMTTPHLAIVGDAPETIVPHDGSQQSKNLWYHAGAKLGMFAGKGIPALASNVKEKLSKTNIKNKFEVNVDYNPIIQGSITNINEMLKSSSEDLVKLIEETLEKIISKNMKLERRVSLD
nr:phage tail tape measure protein [Psychrilyobacter piezotolerans]